MFAVTITMTMIGIMVNDNVKNNYNNKADCQCQLISRSVAMTMIMTIVNPAAGIHDPPLNLLLPCSLKCNPCFVSTNLLSQSVPANSNFFKSLRSYNKVHFSWNLLTFWGPTINKDFRLLTMKTLLLLNIFLIFSSSCLAERVRVNTYNLLYEIVTSPFQKGNK